MCPGYLDKQQDLVVIGLQMSRTLLLWVVCFCPFGVGLLVLLGQTATMVWSDAMEIIKETLVSFSMILMSLLLMVDTIKSH